LLIVLQIKNIKILKSKILLAALITIVGMKNDVSGQDTVKSKVTLGVRINSSYDFEVYRENNFRTLHLAPLFSVNFKHHNFFLGPQYSYILQPTTVTNTIYENNSFGVNVGYRYYSNFLLANTRLFGEVNYSIFQVEGANYQLGPASGSKWKEIYVENTGSLGLDYSVLNQLHISVGFGFGSYTGFFLIFEKFTLTSYLAIEYVF
jgi:hypothetical protein